MMFLYAVNTTAQDRGGSISFDIYESYNNSDKLSLWNGYRVKIHHRAAEREDNSNSLESSWSLCEPDNSQEGNHYTAKIPDLIDSDCRKVIKGYKRGPLSRCIKVE
jgi:hypothetical protein